MLAGSSSRKEGFVAGLTGVPGKPLAQTFYVIMRVSNTSKTSMASLASGPVIFFVEVAHEALLVGECLPTVIAGVHFDG